jgi:hypothetical protein
MIFKSLPHDNDDGKGLTTARFFIKIVFFCKNPIFSVDKFIHN